MSLQALKNKMTGHTPADDLRHARDDIKASLKQTGHDMNRAVHNEAALLKQRGERALEELRERERRVKRAVHDAGLVDSPYFHDVGGEFEATFAQPSLTSKRLVLSTLMQSKSGLDRVTLSTVHDSAPNNEQVTANYSCARTFGPKSVHTTVAKDTKGNSLQIGFDWLRPMRVEMTGYGACSIARPEASTMKLGLELLDIKSGWTLGGAIRHSGVTGLFAGTFKARMPHVALTGTIKGVGGRGSTDHVALGAVSSTLYRDVSRDSTLSAGVQVESGKFNTKFSSVPNSVGGVSAKLEYDEPAFNVDATVRAVAYTNERTNEQTMKLASAWLRALYCTNLGQYPRSAIGAAIGLTHGGDDEAASEGETSAVSAAAFHGDPDLNGDSAWRRVLLSNERLSQLDNPVVSASVYHAFNQNSKMKFRVDSARQVSTSLSYFLTRNITFQTSITTKLPNWDVSTWYTGAGLKNALGLAVNIVAD